jgi:mRNA-degrading endonuclease YafQ of YafQ-DinJ toxin-antitoxin module
VEVCYTPAFIRQFKVLEEGLQIEIVEKIEIFKQRKYHKQLKVHKLHGRLAGRWSFSVNYKIRIVFRYVSKSEVALLAIGDHEVYEK